MRSSRSGRKDNNNQFLQTPHTNRQKIKEKEKLSEDIKAKYIQELQERNRKLKYQILKINEMLEQQNEKPTKKQYKLIPNQSTADVVKKQLENVYKQIKNYQKEINNLQNKQAGGLLTDKLARLENIFNEKAAHLEKLKLQLSSLTKLSLDNSKKLKNNVGREQLEYQMLKYNEQIKLLREKVREGEQREKKKMENAKKQYDYIKKIERQLIENGITIDELEEMKKNNIYNQIYEKMQNGTANDKQKNKNGQDKQIKEQIEDHTVDRYNQLSNQIKIYKKLHQDYEKRLQGLEKQKAEEEKNKMQAKSKLSEKQQEINKLQTQISQLKAKIKKMTIKANYTKPATQEIKKKPVQKIRMLPQNKKQSTQNSVIDQTHLKYDQKGIVSQKGTRFTDRKILGKNFTGRIVGVKVWTQKTTFQITGIQCIYKIGDQIRSGVQNILKECKLQCTENIMDLPDGDYIKHISGNLSQSNIVEYLVMISKDSQISRFGVVKPTHKQFNFDIEQDQIPICLYGSLITPSNKKDCSSIQQIGFQITRDKGYNKDDKFI